MAVTKGAEARQKSLHDAERPIALNTTLIAAQNRDPKKGKPPVYTDFCFYKPLIDGDRPDGAYGSAYVELIRQKRLPPWALFCYKDLSSAALPGYEPTECAFIASDAVLLHPVKVGRNSYQGLLLALESASEKTREFTDDKGNSITLTLPVIGTKIVAQEGVILN